jgi:hypothetical protein
LKKQFGKIIGLEIDEKRLRKKPALIKTDYEEGTAANPSWPPPAGHSQLATLLFVSS